MALLCLDSAPVRAGGFVTAPTYPAGIQPLSFAAGDFNGDGIPDLAVANFNPGNSQQGTLSILLGKGDGSFQAPQSYNTGWAASSVIVADFNGDGHPDLAVFGYDNSGKNTVSILLGNGDGTFQNPQDFVLSSAGSVATGDFNGDGILDLAITSFNAGTVSIWLGNGDGTFHPNGLSYSVGSIPNSVTVGDVNGDGNLDLAVTSEDAGVSILLGNGDGSFQTSQRYAVGRPLAVAVGDLNGDGIPDLAVANFGDAGGKDPGVSILLGNGDGTFQTTQSYATGVHSFSLAVSDLNGDGHLDIVMGGDSIVTVLLGNGNGTFGAPACYAAGETSSGRRTPVLVADFNGDGVLDVAAANAASGVNLGDSAALGTVSILLGKGDGTLQAARCFPPGGGALAVADFNGDGIPDLALTNADASTVNILLGNGNGTFTQSYSVASDANAMTVGDFNGDGIPDLAMADFAGVVSVFLGNGDGTFQAALSMAAGNGPNAIAVGDFNGDGKLDIMTTNFAVAGSPRAPGSIHVIENGIRLFLGNGDGTFQVAQAYAIANDSHPNSVAVGDFNGDGILDLAVTNLDTGLLNIWLGNGDGTFHVARSQSIGPYPQAVTVADFNGDGIPDLAVAAGISAGTVKVLLGNGDGTFQAQSYAVGSNPYFVVTGDFNHDGIPDLAVADVSGVSILLGNGDGTFQAAQSFAAGSGGQMAVADFNRDNFPDLVFSNAATVLLNAP
jgi:hypothetical protein